MSDVQKLIAEARSLIANCATYNFGMRDADRLAHEVAGRLADALEAATSPVEPEPAAGGQDDREALVDMMNRLYNWSTMNWDEIADAILAAGFSRPVGRETATEWGVAGGTFDGVAVKASRAAAEDRAAILRTSWGARWGFSVVERQVTPWSPVSPEQDGADDEH